ncbi:hypothetical protein GY45DRAFT_1324498, partial [Cubamyces sp. BRFM 1775]
MALLSISAQETGARSPWSCAACPKSSALSSPSLPRSIRGQQGHPHVPPRPFPRLHPRRLSRAPSSTPRLPSAACSAM